MEILLTTLRPIRTPNCPLAGIVRMPVELSLSAAKGTTLEGNFEATGTIGQPTVRWVSGRCRHRFRMCSVSGAIPRPVPRNHEALQLILGGPRSHCGIVDISYAPTRLVVTLRSARQNPTPPRHQVGNRLDSLSERPGIGWHADRVRVAIRVRPGAAQASTGGAHAGALIVRVNERAVDGKATAAALAALAKALGVRARDVTLISGARSRTKIVEIPDEARTDYERLLDRTGD